MLFDSNRALADELRNRQIAKGLTSEEDVRNMHDIDLIKCYGECSRCGYLVDEEKLGDITSRARGFNEFWAEVKPLLEDHVCKVNPERDLHFEVADRAGHWIDALQRGVLKDTSDEFGLPEIDICTGMIADDVVQIVSKDMKPQIHSLNDLPDEYIQEIEEWIVTVASGALEGRLDDESAKQDMSVAEILAAATLGKINDILERLDD